MNHSHMLVVDDDEDDRYFLIRTIRKAGIDNEIASCEDGAACIARLSDASRSLPLIVFSDLKMPRMNGFELLAWKNTQPRLSDLPFVVMSGSDLSEDIQRSKTLGAHAYFTKPLSVEEVEMVFKNYAASLIRHSA